ncbi:MAG: hypothetical protein KDI16_05190 [Halioglobus sp.]|nr:hypothetical protein [Halioglobus sp.]
MTATSATNVGFVLYKPGKQPGTLDATWCQRWFGKKTTGSGRATGGPEQGYAGEYKIEYFDAGGAQIATLGLHIKKSEASCFELEWFDGDKIVDIGIGMELPEGLAVGWRHLDETPPPPLAEIDEAENVGY